MMSPPNVPASAAVIFARSGSSMIGVTAIGSAAEVTDMSVPFSFDIPNKGGPGGPGPDASGPRARRPGEAGLGLSRSRGRGLGVGLGQAAHRVQRRGHPLEVIARHRVGVFLLG